MPASHGSKLLPPGPCRSMPVRATHMLISFAILVSVGPLSIYHQRKYYKYYFFFKQKHTIQILLKYWRLLFRIRISHSKSYKYRYSRQRIKATWNSQSKTFLHTAVPVQAMNLKRSITFEKNNDKSYDKSYDYVMIMILVILLISCLTLFTIIFICFF
jgi:hypothetical protein